MYFLISAQSSNCLRFVKKKLKEIDFLFRSWLMGELGFLLLLPGQRS